MVFYSTDSKIYLKPIVYQAIANEFVARFTSSDDEQSIWYGINVYDDLMSTLGLPIDQE